MKIHENSSYYERLEYAEIAKLKDEYTKVGFDAKENFIINNLSYPDLICDLYLENKETGEKIVFEVKAKGHTKEVNELVQMRNKIKKAIPGVKFMLRIIEEPKKPENEFYGIENLIGYLFKHRHQKEIIGVIGNDFSVSNFKDVVLTTIRINDRKTTIKGAAYIELIYKNLQTQNKTVLSEVIYFNFTITFRDLLMPWDYPYFKHLDFHSDRTDAIIDSRVISEFNFDLDRFY